MTTTRARSKEAPTGIEARHGKKCAKRTRPSARCSCVRSYRGGLWNAERKATDWGPWTPSIREAQAWRAKAILEREAGRRRSTSQLTLRGAMESFLDDADRGIVRDQSGKTYKPSTLRTYRAVWKKHIEPDGLAGHKLTAIGHEDWQACVDRLVRKGLAGSTVRKVMCPVQAVYRRALKRGLVHVNPTQGLDLPRADGKRERFATKEEAAELLAALPDSERALWATAFYAGLRRGELRALRWNAVDLDGGLLDVRAGWDDDPSVGEIALKSESGQRRLPIIPVLGSYLTTHRDATRRNGTDFVFGATEDRPFMPSTVRNRALMAWGRANHASEQDARNRNVDFTPLQAIGLHECRHTFASLIIAAGVNAKLLSTLMGHASITITFDRYGKLFPGSEAEASRLLTAFLEPASSGADEAPES